MNAWDTSELAVLIVAIAVSALRWLRVAQREHYLRGCATRFALRWWRRDPLNLSAAFVALGALIASFPVATLSFLVAGVTILAPHGLGIRGRTSKLVWTRRLLLLSAIAALFNVLIVLAGALIDGAHGAVLAAACAAVFGPVVVDAALAATAPIEDHLANQYVTSAKRRLAEIRPRVVGVTGSYGKTSTKGYIAHLAASRLSVLASPRSFNNRAGLARTVNELLAPGTDVLVAEMGAYGPGEIAAMCAWLKPEVSVITAIGPVHLERFKSLERTLAAKAEITTSADIVVLNTDDERLARLAERLLATKTVWHCSGLDVGADVAVLDRGEQVEVFRKGRSEGLAKVASDVVPTNLACAIAVALELGCAMKDILVRVPSLPAPEHRLTSSVSEVGVVVLDDTFNSNPAGANLALEALARRGTDASASVVVTPGMVELGPLQRAENAAFARATSHIADTVVVVKRTNRAALVRGLKESDASPVVVVLADNRDDAVRWVASNLRAGDVVLYENDLPDHYP